MILTGHLEGEVIAWNQDKFETIMQNDAEITCMEKSSEFIFVGDQAAEVFVMALNTNQEVLSQVIKVVDKINLTELAFNLFNY